MIGSLVKINMQVERPRPSPFKKNITLCFRTERVTTRQIFEGIDLLCNVVAVGSELVEHPPYSPDLALTDYRLFPEVKERLSRK